MGNSREQFKKALNHTQTDRLVVDFGSTAVTGIHAKTVADLRKYYGLKEKLVHIIEPYQMLGEVEADLQEALGVDVQGVFGTTNMFGIDNIDKSKIFKTNWGQKVLVSDSFNTMVDEKGNTFVYPEGNMSVNPTAKMPASSYFFDAINRQQEIDEAKLDVKDNLEEFSLLSDSDIDYWKQEITKAERTGKGVIASIGGTCLGDIALVPAMQLLHPKGIRDVSEWYMSTIMRPDYVKAIFAKQTEMAIENLKRLNNAVGDSLDVLFICGTDFGTQTSTFCSPEQFDDTWMPYYKQMNDWIHENTSWKTFKHSCGAVESFMGRFIEAGFDIINPVQISAKDMNPKLLKQKYGKDLTFWGGCVDTQNTLPYGTPQQVRDETLSLAEIFSKDGGFIFNAIHNVQANVPVENVVAMFDAVKEFNKR